MQQPADVPKISQDLSKAVKDLRNYIIDLNAWLKYKLNNLEVENFTEAAQNEIRVTQNGSPADSATYEYVIKHIADAVSRATELITGHQGGYVVLNPSEKPSEILIMDTDNIETATKVWRWNGAGLGYSSTGYDGTYGIAITMDGAINANYITAGVISSLQITGCTITGASIRGSEFIHYPSSPLVGYLAFGEIVQDGAVFYFSTYAANPGFTTGDFVNIDERKYGGGIFSNVEIIGYFGGDINKLILDISVMHSEPNLLWISSYGILEQETPFTLYANNGLLVSDTLGRFSYGKGVMNIETLNGNDLSIHADSQLFMSGENNVFIDSDQNFGVDANNQINIMSKYGTITINAGDDILILATSNMYGPQNITLSNSAFNFKITSTGIVIEYQGGVPWKTFELDLSAGIGDPAFIRTA